jgi:hypothetical protein
MATVLLMMVLALYIASRGSLLASLQLQRRTAALYVAEAGLAETMEYLESNAFVAPGGPLTGTLPGGGTWSVQFKASAPFGDRDSVSNLTNGSAASNSFRGNASVPPYSALVVVQGTVSGVTEVLEAVITRGGGGPSIANALQASGRIRLRGDVSIDGIKALDDPTAVPGNVQSNADAGTTIEWNAGGGTIKISGTVSSQGGSINLGPTYVPGGGTPTTGVTAAFPTVDIVADIAAQAGVAHPPPIVPFGTTILASGDYYHSGDLVLNGDLDLRGGKLYVDGELTVNGSISGEGSVYVGGKTSLKGDAKVRASSGNNVALYSQGSVSLSGFDGELYLNDMASADPPGFGKYWNDAKATVAEMQSLFSAHHAHDFVAGGPENHSLDTLRRTLGQALPGAVVPGRQLNTLGEIQTRLAAQPAGATRTFLEKKFDAMRKFYASESELGLSDNDGQTNWETGNFEAGGTLDSLLDGTDTDRAAALLPDMKAYTANINYDRLGSAYFRGTVYTRGSIHASHDITVIGAVLADGDAAQPAETLPDGTTANPGDIVMDDGTNITFVEDQFSASVVPPAASVRVETWMGR